MSGSSIKNLKFMHYGYVQGVSQKADATEFNYC